MANATSSWSIRGMTSAALILGMIAGAQALPLYDQLVTGADLESARSFGGGLVKGGGNITKATLSWDIDFVSSTARWTYSYRFTEDSAQSISHFILDLSDSCTARSGCIISRTFRDNSDEIDFEYGTFDRTNGNPNFPGRIVGVKFDDLEVDGGTFTFSFQSERAPVWGDFYAKGGNGSSNGFAIYNAGAANHDSELKIDFIARPDTVAGRGPSGAVAPVSAPASLLLLGAGLVGLAASRKRSA